MSSGGTNCSMDSLLEVAASETMRHEALSAINTAFSTQLANGHQPPLTAITASKACLVRLLSGPSEASGNRRHEVHAANVGNAFWVVLRRQGPTWCHVAFSKPTFHQPNGDGPALQIAYNVRGQWVTQRDVRQRAHHCRFPIQSGDLVLAMSDGAGNNFFPDGKNLEERIVARMNRGANAAGNEWTPERLVTVFKHLVQSWMRSNTARYDDYSIVAAKVAIGLPTEHVASLAPGAAVFPVQEQES